MHLRYMRRLERQRELALGGELGRVIRVYSCFRVPRVPMAPGDFRLRAELGGGAGLDIGCYAVSCLRCVAGEEPEVVAVRRRLIAPDVDRWMRADVRFPSGATGRIECGFRGLYVPRMTVTVTCEKGAVTWSPAGLAVRRRGRSVQEAVPPDWTYQRQLEAFARRVRGQATEVVTPEDSVRTAAVLDAMYARAGLGARGGSQVDVP
jgi:predicted dehydrogenase